MTVLLRLEVLRATALTAERQAGKEADLAVDVGPDGIPRWNGSRIRPLLSEVWDQMATHFPSLQPAASIVFPTTQQLVDAAHGFRFPSRLEIPAGDRQWFEHAASRLNSAMSREVVLEYFTTVRRRTARSRELRGAPRAHTLRAVPVLRRGLVFEGELLMPVGDADLADNILNLLALISGCVRSLGVGRNAGSAVSLTVVKDGDPVQPRLQDREPS